MRAKVCRFYGISPRAYARLDLETRNELWDAISVIEAQDFLVQMSLMMVPHIKDESRQELHRKHHRIAYPHLYETTIVATAQQIQQRLAKGR